MRDDQKSVLIAWLRATKRAVDLLSASTPTPKSTGTESQPAVKLTFEDEAAASLRERRAAHDKESPIPGHPNEADASHITTFLAAVGLPTDMNYLVHFSTLVAAQRIYVRRYPSYLDEPIRQMGIKGILVQARTCVERTWTRTFVSHIGSKQPKLDDAYDGINYLAHFIAQSHLKNDGTWNWGD